MIYADAEYYKTIYSGTVELTSADLRDASRDIDILTFGRTSARWDELTEYQQNIIKECVCKQAEFRHENADLLESALSSYSLNGASVSFNGVATKVVDGVCVLNSTYKHLELSGLCCRSVMA